ncbi:MAG: hypothetical protein A2284_04530 [Deltaproteobacteria bacterium RIFOXYA12_FULL_61_11]|nr:MAG: hypothetical protein A2284_04530 [Deltaproteobacteria bacterium RIFOXYA12_FULL_61_11]
MGQLSVDLLPVLLLALLGQVLRRFAGFGPETSGTLLRLVLKVTLPALLLSTLPTLDLTPELAMLPLLAAINAGIAYLLGSRLLLPWLLHRGQAAPTAATAALGVMIANTSFILPFLGAVHGAEGLTLGCIYDLGNAVIIYTVVYSFAVRRAKHPLGRRAIFFEVLTLPPLWGLFLGASLNVLALELPPPLYAVAHPLGAMTVPLLLLSLGLSIERLPRPEPALLAAIALRMGMGVLVGLFFAEVFALEGVARSIILAGCAAPIGFNTLVFASAHELDADFAARLLSASLLLGMLSTPLLLHL